MAGKDSGQIPQAHQVTPLIAPRDSGRHSQQLGLAWTLGDCHSKRLVSTKNGNIKRLKQVCCIGSVVRRAIVKNQNGWTGTTIVKFPFSKLNERVTSAFSTQQSSSTFHQHCIHQKQSNGRQDKTSPAY
ncbi:hypothetical protein Ae201684_004775 [Aphanomyces euteiches]|uniref:Uncharacterized protein n=1 Tax=Aphanomyces euteiches TaxID=100861 RepID=A0A6G0XH60_9STRA|nr:hypothetical protein Ae201684_004775 [Aphanomyces euteiches]